MCTRCVRFTREISQTGELEVMRRGNHAEIDIFPGHPVDNPLAGNVVDLCPVGALLDKDFLHKQRVWFLSKHDSICTRCSTGCNITAEENRGALWRFKPRQNPHVNDYWICDEGRYSYKAANDPHLLAAMYVQRDGDHRAVAGRRGPQGRGAGLPGDRPARRGRRRSALAVPDRRGGLPAGPLPQGLEPGQRAGDGTDPDAGDRPDLPSGPDQGPHRRYQLRRAPAVHDPRREVPEPPRRRGDPRPFRGQGDPLRGADAARVGGRIPGPVCRLGLHRTLDRRNPEPDPAIRREVPGRAGYERHAPGATGGCGPRRRDVRREGRLLSSTPMGGSNTPRPPCPRATARSRTSTCSRSC